MIAEDEQRITVPIGDWWWLASAFVNLCAYGDARPVYGHGPGGYGIRVHWGDVGNDVGRLLIVPGLDSTELVASWPRGDERAAGFWGRALAFLGGTAEEARDLRREVAPSNDELVERYYRQRAAGGRATLRQIAEQHGISYTALRQHKVGYDRAGKWGSKRNVRITDTKERI